MLTAQPIALIKVAAKAVSRFKDSTYPKVAHTDGFAKFNARQIESTEGGLMMDHSLFMGTF